MLRCDKKIAQGGV